MEVIPAIDLRGGKCVRLYQGDYERETVYSNDALEVAAAWSELGAKRLHIVDLDGARSGAPANLDVVAGIVSSVATPLQFGGGVRTLETAKAVVGLGVDRIILGSAATTSPELIPAILRDLHSDAVVVSVDARDGYVATEGWTKASSIAAVDLVDRMKQIGVQRFLYTDIGRDGTLAGPNLEGIRELVARSGVKLMAAGGIASVAHLASIAETGAEAAIVGRALYTRDVDLREAIAAVVSS